MMDNGEAYIIMLKRMHTIPTIMDRRSWVWTM
ncbi:hypothetical protein CRG98_048964, partial [Punica granatum]